MKQILFFLRFIFFSVLFFVLGHGLWRNWLSQVVIFSDGRLDYGEFLLVFLLIASSVFLGYLAALSFNKKQAKVAEVRWEEDSSKDTVIDIVAPQTLEKVEAAPEASAKEDSKDSKSKTPKRSRFQQAIQQDINLGGKK